MPEIALAKFRLIEPLLPGEIRRAEWNRLRHGSTACCMGLSRGRPRGWALGTICRLGSH